MTDDAPVDALRQCLQRAGLGPDDTLLLACSGGRDSQVLMHTVAALRPVVRAAVAHVHHGLQQLPLHQLFKGFMTGPSGDAQVQTLRRIYAESPNSPPNTRKTA